MDRWSWLKKQPNVSTHIDPHPPTPNTLLVNEDPQSHEGVTPENLLMRKTNPQSATTAPQQHLLLGNRTPPPRHQATATDVTSTRLLGNKDPPKDYFLKGEKIMSEKTVTTNSKLQGKENPPKAMSKIENIK